MKDQVDQASQNDESKNDVKSKRSRPAAAAERIATPYDRDKAQTNRKRRRKHIKETLYNKTPEKFKNASEFQVRFRTGFVYVAVTIVCILASDISTMVLLAATAGICAGEFYYMVRADAKLPNETIGVVGAVFYPVATHFLGMEGIVYVTVALLLALTVWYVFWVHARMPDVGVSLFGAVYTGLLLSGLIFIRDAISDPWGGVLLLLIFLSIWTNDAFAYFIGSKFGRHKLAPRTSPKKSWEGFFGGLVGSMLVWALIVLVPEVNITIYQALVFGFVCGLAGVMGDLCESRIKRSVGMKDSGVIMPGHGGLFDRCDSLMTTAVVAAVLLFSGGCLPLF